MARGLFPPAHRETDGAIGDEVPAKPEEKAGGLLRSGLTRRAFLVRGSLAAGAAALIGSVPGVGNILTTAEADSPEIEGGGAAAGAEAGPTMSQPIVAHVVNLGTGEINFYQGTAQVVARNPGLAQAIARLAAQRT
jgi:hypothetical protein